MNNNAQNYAEISVCPKTMNNMPESSSPWFTGNADGVAKRADTVGEMMVLVRKMAAAVLTHRQKVIFGLWDKDHTQVEIAGILGISQAAVSCNLMGQMKRGKAVGGAMQKIRKSIRRAAAQGCGTDSRHRQLISVLNRMLDQPATRRVMDCNLKNHS
ncbi:MAG: hypothetical protein WCN95_12780 [bacterium]